MKNRFTLIASVLMCWAGSLMAQTADKESLGFFSVWGYPYCQIDTTAETWSIVTDHIVPITNNTTFIRSNVLQLGCSYRTSVASPDGADIVVAINDYFEKTTPIVFDELYKKRPAPRKKSTQSNQKTVLKIGKFTYISETSEPKKDVGGPQPVEGPSSIVALATREIGFNVEVKTQAGLVYTDTLYFLRDFVSSPFLDKKLAADDLNKRLSSFTLGGELNNYTPFLSKVIGSTVLSTVKLHLYKVKVKKKCTIDYTDINSSVEKFQEAFDFIKKRPFELDRFKELAAPSVQVWKDAIAQSNPTDANAKVNKEVTAAMYYNMAIYCALCREFEGCESYFKKADQVYFDFADAARMAKLVKTWTVARENYIKSLSEF